MTALGWHRLNLAGAAGALLTLALAVLWAFPLLWSLYVTVAADTGQSTAGFIGRYFHALFETSRSSSSRFHPPAVTPCRRSGSPAAKCCGS